MAAAPDGGPLEPADAGLDRLAAVTVDAVAGQLPPASDEDDRTVRRVRTVVDAIRAAAEHR